MTHDQLTTAAAAGAIASPYWLPALKQASEVAGQLAPILGVVWLFVQIVTKLRDLARPGAGKAL